MVSTSTLAGGAAVIVGGGFDRRAGGRKAAFEGAWAWLQATVLASAKKFDESKLEARPAGSFFTEPKGVRHFGMTKDEGVVLYFVGTGPSTTDNLEK